MTSPVDSAWTDVDAVIRDFVDSDTFRDLAARTATDIERYSGDVPHEAAGLPAGASLQVARGTAPASVVFVYGPWRGDELVAVASASKWPAVMTMLSVVEDGTVGLDDLLGRWFPRLEGTAATITFRQLLSHTSGITPFHPALSRRGCSLEQCVDAILSEPLIGVPGTQFAYGGSSMQVAARVCELATGHRWVDLFRSRITRPLGIDRMRYGESPNPRVPGGVITDLAGLDRVLECHVGGGMFRGRRILSEETIVLMETIATGDLPVADPYGNPRCGYGLGLWVDAVGGDGRSTAFSSPGAWGTVPWIDRSNDYRAVLMTYGIGVEGSVLGRELAERLSPLIADALGASRES